jgi:transcriptional regulator with XRE-family HTH domain
MTETCLMNVPMPDFARWLEATMESRGLTQAAIAREVGVADAQVSRWRRGQVTPSVRHLQRIADTFGVPRVQLDRMAGYPVENQAEPARDDPERAAELQSHVARLEQLLADRVPRELWTAYAEACAALAETLSSSFDQAQRRIESAREAGHRPIGFRRDE